MKQQIIFLFSFISAIFCNAQTDVSDQLTQIVNNRYPEVNDSYESIAKIISEEIPLNEKGEFVYSEIIEFENKSKESIFESILSWQKQTFNKKNSKITKEDLSSGRIIIQDHIKLLKKSDNSAKAVLLTGRTDYTLIVKPIIQIDIKEGRVRITCKLSEYEVSMRTKNMIGIPSPFKKTKHLQLADVQPYANKALEKGKWYSSEDFAVYPFLGLIYSRCYLDLYIDSLKEAVKKDTASNENDDW